MAISQSRYVSITSGMAGQAALGARNLNGLLFTYGKGWIGKDLFPSDKILVCYSISQVLDYFSSSSEEVKFATKYFSYASPSGGAPTSLSFAKMKVTDDEDIELVWEANSSGTFGWYSPGAYASGTLTFGTNIIPTAGTANKIVVGDVQYDLVEYRTSVNQILIAKDNNGAVDPAGTAANAVAVINGSGGFYGQTANPAVKASAAGSIVTVTAIDRGTGGNTIALSGVTGVAASGNGYLANGSADVAASIEQYEAPQSALSRIEGGTNNFGSFAFLPDANISDTQLKAVAVQNAGYNYKYLFSVGTLINTSGAPTGTSLSWASTFGAMNGTAMSQGVDATIAAVPMAIFAATDYEGTGTATNYMFKQISGELPSVTSDQDADILDGLHVNYYGRTQSNGQQLDFYQRGVNLDGQDTAVYCNEVWFKSAVATAIMNLLVSVERVPANEDGESMLNSTITGVAQRAVRNGMFEIGKTFTEAQRAQIFQFTGDPDAVVTMQVAGYWLNVLIEEDGNEYKARYVLVYSKGDSIKKVEGRDILI